MNSGPVILRGGLIADLLNEEVQAADIEIRDGWIVHVAANLPRSDAEEIDVSGLVLLPGLINMHEHLTMKRTWGPTWDQMDLADPYLVIRAVRAAMRDVQSGVTTIRELGAKNHLNIFIKRAIAAKAIPGPRTFAAGAPITTTGGHAWKLSTEADGPGGIAVAVRQTIKAGADWIKLISSNDPVHEEHEGQHTHPELSREEFHAAVQTAHLARRRITSHTMGRESLGWAIEAGVDSIEHGIYLDEELATQMKTKGIALIPTLSGYYQTILEHWDRGADWIARHNHLLEPHQTSARIAIDQGLRIGVGTDTVGDYVEELEMLVRCGMTTGQALHAATAVNADILGAGSTLGQIREGMRADCVALEKNPLESLGHLTSLRLVVQDGAVSHPQDLTLPTLDETSSWNTLTLRNHH